MIPSLPSLVSYALFTVSIAGWGGFLGFLIWDNCAYSSFFPSRMGKPSVVCLAVALAAMLGLILWQTATNPFRV